MTQAAYVLQCYEDACNTGIVPVKINRDVNIYYCGTVRSESYNAPNVECKTHTHTSWVIQIVTYCKEEEWQALSVQGR